MNLAPVSVEHSHGDCAGHPGHVRDKFERAHAASRVGAQFPNDIRQTVKILDSVLHFRDPRAQASWTMGRWRPSCCAGRCRKGREEAPQPIMIWPRRLPWNICGAEQAGTSPSPQILASETTYWRRKIRQPKSGQFRIGAGARCGNPRKLLTRRLRLRTFVTLALGELSYRSRLHGRG